jgi:NTE family protein
MIAVGDCKIGLALSGGGLRAVAFHLGCLRALHRLGILDRVEVISTVSGGSVIGACFHAHAGDFPTFEKKIRTLLAGGLAGPMRRKLFSLLGLKIIATFLLVSSVAVCVSFVRLLVKALGIAAPKSIAGRLKRLEIHSPLHRFASRTTLLEAVLNERLFNEARLADLPEHPRLVINATELRTGSAFRFSALESGSWRWGKLHSNSISVAHAVAASAAYPLFLPAFDETLTFDKNGERSNHRVLLTDGGVYDNLGLGCLWPNRSDAVSLNVIPVDTILCCSAGYGLRQEPPSQFLVARMFSVFNAIFDRAQNAAVHRLHEAKRTGQIKGFILPYLGQLDRELADPPADLVRREEAHSYPTDFNAMSDEWIERLSLRGEQLTVCLARAHLPELVS